MDIVEKLQRDMAAMTEYFNGLKEKLANDINEVKAKNEEKAKEEKVQALAIRDVRVYDSIRPTLEVLTHSESTVKIGRIQDEMKELVAINSKSDTENVAAVLERINDPNTPTKDAFTDEYGLTEEERKYLFGYIYTVEGGYFFHESDKGGETNYGIIKEEARKWGYEGEMKDLPKELTLKIYQKDYYEKFKLRELNHFGKQLCIFDACVHAGTNGIKMAQKAINKAYITRSTLEANAAELKELSVLAEDGKIGPKTIEALNKIPFGLFYTNFLVVQENYYEKIFKKRPDQIVFDEGWENRLYKKNQYIYRLLKDDVITWE